MERSIHSFSGMILWSLMKFSLFSAGYDTMRADRKRRKSEVLGLPLYVPEQEDPVVELVGEQSMKIECGCCFDDSCSFVSSSHSSHRAALTHACQDDHDTMCRWPSLLQRLCTRSSGRGHRKTTACKSRLYPPKQFTVYHLMIMAPQQDITCMDTSGCKLAFPSAELQKCLKEPTFNLWQKIVQAEDIAAANLAGLEHCPACDFAMIFEIGVEAAPLLHCLKSDCRLVSCRRCKKKVSIVISTTTVVHWIYALG